MRCENLNIYLDDYLAERLDGSLKDDLEKHIEGCSGCKQKIDTEREWLKLLGSDKIDDPGESYWDSFEERIAERIGVKQKNLIESEAIVKNGGKVTFIKYLIPLAASFALFFGMLGIEYVNNDNIKPTGKPSAMLTELINSGNRQIGDILLSPPGSAGYHLSLSSVKLQNIDEDGN